MLELIDIANPAIFQLNCVPHPRFSSRSRPDDATRSLPSLHFYVFRLYAELRARLALLFSLPLLSLSDVVLRQCCSSRRESRTLKAAILARSLEKFDKFGARSSLLLGCRSTRNSTREKATGAEEK